VNPPRPNALSEIFVTDPFGNGTKRLMSGAQPDGDSFAPYLSRTGRFVAFESDSSTSQSPGNLPSGLPPLADTNNSRDILVSDRDPDTNGTLDDTPPNITRVNLTAGGAAQAGTSLASGDPLCAGFPLWGSREAQVTPDGRHVLFSSDAQLDPLNDQAPGFCIGSVPNVPLAYIGLSVYAVDRDPDGNGVFDEGNQTTTLIGGPTIGGNLATLRSPSILGAGPVTADLPIGRQMTDDGRFVVYDSFDNEDAVLDLDLCPDVYLLDRDSDGNGSLDEPGGTRRYLVSRDNASPAVFCTAPATFHTVQSLSDDGERVVFLEIGVGVLTTTVQVFLFDLAAEDPVLGPSVPGALTLVSKNVFGAPADRQAGLAHLLDNGASDFVAFGTAADFILEDDVDGLGGSFFRDPESGLTVGAQGGAPGSGFDITTVQLPFQGAAINSAEADTLAPGDTNGLPDVVLGYVDFTLPWNAAQDVNADGDINDGYFRIADVGAGGQQIALEADTYGAMAPDGSLAYTRNEGDLADPTGVDRNGDGDIDDLVIYLHPGRGGGASLLPAGAAQVLDKGQGQGFAIFEDAPLDQTLAASNTRVAALISEAGEGVDFTQDGDLDDGVLGVWDRVGGGWTLVPSSGPEPVSALILQDDFVGVSVSEEEAGADLNGDFDLLDEVGFVYDATNDTVSPTDQAVSDAMFGENIIAFRTPEADQGQDLNNDGDMNDFVLQVWDLANQKVISSGSSAVLCEFEICDPTRPFRIEDDVVRFLTREQDEGRDLNDDFDTNDLIVQLFNPFAAQGAAPVQVVTTVTEPPPSAPGEPPPPSVGFDPLAPPPLDEDGGSVVQIGQGICRDQAGAPGTTCNTDADCLQAAGETCQPEATAVAAQNSDGDPIPDPLDNCPTVDNADQLDRDFDGVGDLCDAETCGDGFITGSETCDDSQLPPLNGDGCSQFCRVAGCGGDVNLDGFVNQTDVDQFGNSAGCYPCQGPGCNEALCDLNADTHVNNADVLLLQGIIPAQCAPGGGILGSPPPPSCGLGPELALLLPALLALRRRRRSPAC
jgi:cysteine-rich repeat protein